MIIPLNSSAWMQVPASALGSTSMVAHLAIIALHVRVALLQYV